MQRDDSSNNGADNNGAGCDCSFFDYGDWVEFKLNTNVFGIVIGADIHGLIYSVQLAGSGIVQNFHGVTLRHMDDDDLPPGEEESLPDNVIQVDFTKAKELRANTKTRGAA